MNKSKGNKKQDGPKSQWALMLRKFKRNKLAQLGMLIIGALFLLVLFAPFFSPYDYHNTKLKKSYRPPQRIHFVDQEGNFHWRPFTYKIKRSMDSETFTLSFEEEKSERYPVKFFTRSWEYSLFGLINTNLHLFGVEGEGNLYIFGTDGHGRDLFSRTLAGGRITLSVALLGTFLTGIIGSLLGGISGYYGGLMDMLIQRAVEVVRCFPKIALWMSLSVAIPSTWPPIYILYGVIMIFALLQWPLLAREVRGKVIEYQEKDFVLAARSVGANDLRIIIRHVLPQAASHIIVSLTVTVPWIILGESMLSFLGLGIQPPMISWGVLLQKAQNFQTLGLHPWIMIPGLFIVASVLGFNFLGDGLRDAVDPFSQ